MVKEARKQKNFKKAGKGICRLFLFILYLCSPRWKKSPEAAKNWFQSCRFKNWILSLQPLTTKWLC